MVVEVTIHSAFIFRNEQYKEQHKFSQFGFSPDHDSSITQVQHTGARQMLHHDDDQESMTTWILNVLIVSRKFVFE